MDVGPLFVANTQPPDLIQAGDVRSTTQRHRPKPLPRSVFRIASKGMMWRARRPWRIVSASYPRSPNTQSGRWRGRPRSPCRGGMASTSARACCEPFRLAAVSWMRNTLTVANQMTLAAKLGSIGGVGTRLKPPKTARTELPSTTARDQSICP